MFNKKVVLYLILIILASAILFFPSFNTFFTNDDFYLLNISKATSVNDVASFFNIFNPHGELGVYRPLSTQLFYSLSNNPIVLHTVAFMVYCGLLISIYVLVYILTRKRNLTLVATFLYAISTTHFAHFYYLATFQEVAMTLFFILSVIYYYKFIDTKKNIYYLVSVITFLLSLMSKETAIVLPLILLVIHFYHSKKINKQEFIKATKYLFTFIVITGFYLFARIYYYGFATGDSYIWDVSLKVINSYFWYVLWSLGLPETLVDFIGPGARINLTLFKYWGNEYTVIFISFFTFLLFTAVGLVKTIKKKVLDKKLFILLSLWFLITLIPVIFLPWHKFSYYLTLPLVSVVVVLAIIFQTYKNAVVKTVFIFLYLLLNIATLQLTHSTHWISRGSLVAKNVYNYTQENRNDFQGKVIVFHDTSEDVDLPWSPTKVLKDVLSDKHFFEVYYPNEFEVEYNKDIQSENMIRIQSRQFLNY